MFNMNHIDKPVVEPGDQRLKSNAFFFVLDISTGEMKNPNCVDISEMYRQKNMNKIPFLSSPPHPTMTPHTSVC